jgi:transcriptional regulator with XRE-family HTH domain
MTTLAQVAEALKNVRRQEKLTQGELAARAGLARSTVTRLETLAQGDIGMSAFLRLLEAAGYDLKVVKAGSARTLTDILAEQRRGETSK